MDTTPWKAAAALALAATALAGPPAAHSAEPAMHWYRWSPAERSSLLRSASVGRTAVLGVDSISDLPAVRQRYGLRVVQSLPYLRAAVVTVTRALGSAANRDSRIRYLSTDYVLRHPTALPNDPLLALDPWTQQPYEWQFAAARVDAALRLSPGSPRVVVGIIDSGVAAVPDLAGKVDERWTVSSNGKLTRDRDASDVIGHGTAVASLIAANVDDGFGMAGFGGAAHVAVVHAWTFNDVATATALMKLDSLGVRIVNLSFGGDAPETPIMLDAINMAAADGLLLVAAAGNSAHAVAHPAADLQPPSGAPSYGLAVGASDVHGEPAFFSNFGENLSLLAPGANTGACSGVLVASAPAGTAFDGTCYPTWAGEQGSVYAYASGTSFAAPEVAGVAALVWAARPTLENDQVAGILKASARRSAAGWTPTAGCGLLDAGAAVELALSRSPAAWADAGVPTC